MEIEKLVLEAKKGNDDAFYMLLSEHKTKLYRIAYSYFGNENDSLEAIQEVTYRAYVKLQNLKEPRYFTTWLIRILIHYCIDELKKKKRIIFRMIEKGKSTENENVNRVGIEQAIEKLDPKLKTIIILNPLLF